MSRWVDVGYINEIAPQECKLIEIERKAIAIFNLSDGFYAIEDNCPHQHLPLADGLVEGDVITCPYHNAKFNLKSGAVLAPPACENLTIFSTRVVEDKIQIEI